MAKAAQAGHNSDRSVDAGSRMELAVSVRVPSPSHSGGVPWSSRGAFFIVRVSLRRLKKKGALRFCIAIAAVRERNAPGVGLAGKSVRRLKSRMLQPPLWTAT
jgi:hypothetical protein